MDSFRLAAAILTAPALTRIGLASADDRVRQRAADALAQAIIDQLDGSTLPGPDQLALSLEGSSR